jgi:hypothetical protein
VFQHLLDNVEAGFHRRLAFGMKRLPRSRLRAMRHRLNGAGVRGWCRVLAKALGHEKFVALSAGGGVVNALTATGPITIAMRIMITLLPALVAYVAVVGRQMLGKNTLLLLGSITGAMTSASALSVVTDAVRSSVRLARPSTNTFVNVLFKFAAALMMVLKCQ